METQNKELRWFALDTLHLLAQAQNEKIANSCYDILHRALKEMQSMGELTGFSLTQACIEPATTDDIANCLTLQEVVDELHISKQWLCNWANRNPEHMVRKGKIRLWKPETVEMARDAYWGRPSRQAAEAGESGKPASEVEERMGEGEHAGGDDGEHRDTGGQTDKVPDGFPVCLSGPKERRTCYTWEEAMDLTGLTRRQLEEIIFRNAIVNKWIRIYPEE